LPLHAFTQLLRFLVKLHRRVIIQQF